MKEIKFRGKRLDNNEWVYGYYFYDKFDAKSHYILQAQEDNIEPYPYKIIPKTLGQYTGLKDDNGVEIYEGDIVKVLQEITVSENGYLDREVIREVNYVVVFDLEELDFKATNGKDEYGRNFKYLCCCDDLLQVIGNIYENPELSEVI